MGKRLISANASEILQMTAAELKQSIKASEGRTILSENVAPRESFIGDITNSEIARAFGADLILLNCVDVLDPCIFGLEVKEGVSFVDELHNLVGRPIGVNLEPVDLEADMAEDLFTISKGRQANLETIKEIEKLGMDFVCFTGNPGTGVTNSQIEKTIRLAKENFSGLIIAGKMHGAGVNEPVADLKAVKSFIDAGADIILVPAVGTVPGFDDSELREVVRVAHENGALVLTAIGTSQESSDEDTIKQIAIRNKICGVDIQHIGDAGYGGVAPFENIFAMSKAIRGVRHTVSMIARSINR
ncbi:haloacid dehalogenase-like hydrolase [Clostridium sartagoforme]|uniref:Haloacid dehalogenase-like hydrolase n=1 Tax=Clostridium sartagoforme TaxID=84031 RepID=A0A4S2DN07_9CLOT|nr:haloacid dehalogenase-like hydrolase [Clostridium sartagoforme]TGY42371.1 haloacid dehalogenase-like hydrolase [Clostridium sartagoforme]